MQGSGYTSGAQVGLSVPRGTHDHHDHLARVEETGS